jgi:hypothetical protein
VAGLWLAKQNQQRLYHQHGKTIKDKEDDRCPNTGYLLCRFPQKIEMTKLARQWLICTLLNVMLLIAAACTPAQKGENNAATQVNPSSGASEAFSSNIIEKTPEIYAYEGALSLSQILEKIFAPQWKTLWLTGYLVDQSQVLAYYVNAWLGRDGRGSLVVSEALDRLVKQPDALTALPVAEEQLSDGLQISSSESTDWLNVKGQWTYHPFEKSDRFMSLFFPLNLPHDANWQIAGSSIVAGQETVVLEGDIFRLWVDVRTGVLLRLEVFSQKQQNTPFVSIQVEAIQYDPRLPARTMQIVPHAGHEPSLAERPAAGIINLTKKPLNFHKITRDVNHPPAGLMVDIYQENIFLGTLDLGSAGFYCDRAADWNHFAFLYQPPGKSATELRWLNLQTMETVNTVEEIQSPSTPIWSPTRLQLAVTGYRTGEDPGLWKTFLVNIPSEEIAELGPGSLVPPAWSNDGRYVFGLDPTYSNLLLFDADTQEQVSSWAFNSEYWQVDDPAAPIGNDEIRDKLPRNGFDYPMKCALP